MGMEEDGRMNRPKPGEIWENRSCLFLITSVEVSSWSPAFVCYSIIIFDVTEFWELGEIHTLVIPHQDPSWDCI